MVEPGRLASSNFCMPLSLGVGLAAAWAEVTLSTGPETA